MCNNCTGIDFGARVSTDIKGLKIGFKYSGRYVSCLMQRQQTLRCGIAVCSKKDDYKIGKGEIVALEKALLQFPMDAKFQFKVWQDYFAFRPLKGG